MNVLARWLLLLLVSPAFAAPERGGGGEPPPPNLAFDLHAHGAVRVEVQVHPRDHEPVRYGFDAPDGVAAAGVYVPPGDGTLVSVIGYDERGEALYKGETIAHVDEKFTPQFSVALEGGDGKEVNEARFGTNLLELSWAPGEGDRLVIRASLLDAFGKHVAMEPEFLDWGFPIELELPKYTCFRDSLCIELPDPGVHADRIACYRDVTCWSQAPKDYDGPYLRVAVGRNHTCALLKNGDVRCWGDNFAGQLGAPTGFCAAGRRCSVDPVTVVCPASETCKFVAVSAGGDHTCAIDTAGQAWCWGDKPNGATGEFDVSLTPDSPVHRHVPAFTPLGARVKFSFIDTSLGHTCALSDTQDLYCWGGNGRGELGYPQSHNNGTTKATMVLSGNKYQAVSLGRQHTCAIQAGNGLVDCWGDNFDRQLTGNANSATFITINSKVPLLTGNSANLVAAGDSSTCAQINGTDVGCWGSPDTGAPFSHLTPGYVALKNGYVRSLASDIHACGINQLPCTRICAAGGYPDLYCGNWLNGTPAQLQPVPTPKNYHYISYVQVDVGPEHVCAVTTHNDIYCFGMNSFGQFGTGARSSTPTASPETPTLR